MPDHAVSLRRPGTASRRRPQLLFLCQTLPYPPDGGVSIRTYNVLRLLARDFDITALCFYRAAIKEGAEQIESARAALGELAEVEVFPIPQEHRNGRMLRDHLLSLVSGRVYTAYSYESAQFRERLEYHLARRSFDLVHVDSLDLSAYLPLLKDLPVVCVHHNVESELLGRRAQAEDSAIRRLYMAHQAGLMAREEEKWCPRCTLNVTVSDADRATFEERIPSARFTVVPNGVDTTTFRPASTPEHTGGIVFVGGTTWFPNRDALHFFRDHILPHIRVRGVDAPVHWIGRATEEEVSANSGIDGLTLTGYVDDIRPLVQDAGCYVVPLRVGGGTRLKVLDAWAMGKAVVSTSVGCEGLDTRDGENILIRDEPAEFAEAVCRVLHDPALRATIGRNARATVERLYGWNTIGQRLLEDYHALLAPALHPGERSPRPVNGESPETNP